MLHGFVASPATTAATSSASTTIMPSVNIDSSDELDEMTTTSPHIVPKITIKPIRPPSSNDGLQSAYEQQNDDNGNERNHHRYHHSHNHHHHSATMTSAVTMAATTTATSTATPTSAMTDGATMTGINHHNVAPQEAIPKLKIKVDSTSSTLQNLSSFSATNSSSCSSSISNSSSSSISQVQNSAGAKEAISLVSDEGVKVTLKPLSEPPLPKLTIKTNTATDTAEVVLVNNTSSMRSDYLTAHTNSSSSLSSSYSVNNAEDNLSTCSSGSASSFSSSSSSAAVGTSKIIIKATSTGSTIDERHSPSKRSTDERHSDSKWRTSSDRVAAAWRSSGEAVAKKTTKRQTEQSKLADALRTASPVQKSSTRGTAKLIADENIVIPKVTIKPVLNPNDGPDVCSSEQPRVTPKIILKPIPKPIDKPLEIITAPGSPFSRSSEASESQQSPRIILKINKNATSQTTEAILLTKPSSMLASPSIHTTTAGTTEAQTNSTDSKSSITQNELKRLSSTTKTHAKKLKLMTESEDEDDVVHLLSSDSESEALNHSIDESDLSATSPAVTAAVTLEQTLASTPSDSSNTNLHANSDLRSILSRPQLKFPPPLQNFAAQSINIVPSTPSSTTTLTSPNAKILNPHNAGDAIIGSNDVSASVAEEDENDIGKSSDVIDLCHDSNDELTCKMQLNSEITCKMPANYDDKETSTQNAADVTTPPTLSSVVTPTIATLSSPSTTITTTTSTTSTVATDSNQKSTTDHNQHNKSSSNYKWPFFYGVEEKRPEPIHPLLQHNIARANVLEAMMNAANNQDKCHTANGANNNSTPNDNNFEKSSKRKSDLLLDNDGSSSDCIVIEDTGSEPFPFGSGDKIADQNGQKKESVDRDSGVDVSSSIKSASGDGHDDDATPVKRPRGRPRKDGTPAGSTASK